MVDVCDHTIIPSAFDQFRRIGRQGAGDGAREMRVPCSLVPKDIKDSELSL